MNDPRLARLLDRAVPTIPDRLRTAPLDAVRARVRRRRARRVTSALVAVVLVVLIGPALWYARANNGSGEPPAGVVNTPSASASPNVPWGMAKVDRAGTTITVFVAPPDDRRVCQGEWEATATAASGSDRVIITSVGSPGPSSLTASGCPHGDAFMAPVTLTLPAPLGSRPLIDAYDGLERPAYREEDLPTVPGGGGGWSEVHTSFGGGDSWMVSYTREGGPDVWIQGFRRDGAPAPDGPSRGTVKVGSYRAVIYLRSTGTFEVRWETTKVVYTLTLQPSEGQSLTLSAFRTVLAQIGIT